MLHAVAEVELHILLGKLHGTLRCIHRANLHSTSRSCINRETTSVAECVEYGTSLRVVLHQLAVLSLVEEETCLLTLLPVYEELLAILLHDVCLVVALAPDVAIHSVQSRLKRYGLRALVVNGGELVAIGVTQSLGNSHTREVHTHRVALHNSHLVVDVNHQAWQRVALAVYQTIAVCLLVVSERKRTTHIIGDGYAVVPPRLIYLLLLFEGKHTHGNRANLIVTASDKLARLCEYIHYLALFYLALALYTLNGTRKYPGVATQQRLLLTSSKINLCSHISVVEYPVLVCCGGVDVVEASSLSLAPPPGS